ncbi:MAG: hypothetical protein A370_00514 [Clostridium sp. Maddingley MBC34-26]|nr:MAG: hypothetical protein A370_00514 [Clostridium sp. Maddingley MBC34-26]
MVFLVNCYKKNLIVYYSQEVAIRLNSLLTGKGEIL